MAKTPRTWTGARTPSGLKRVRSAERRHAILGPRRATAKTLVKNALTAATNPSQDVDAQVALTDAISALDRAAKAGAIHPNAAARRKSRLVRKVNAAGVGLAAGSAHVAKTVGRAAAQKAAKARIAASKAGKAKGAQTAAGKARAALSKSSRAEAAAAAAAAKAPAAEAKAASKPAGKASTKTATKAAPKAAKSTAKSAAEKPAAKATTKKAPAKKAAKA
ncbi:MAG TPA: 30S ribosomal protein S20 [Candidatus Limnocylindrales bacterium]|nr:30S ribosomal protein S20 [Candidatus Limnocylindrales bacterium]